MGMPRSMTGVNETKKRLRSTGIVHQGRSQDFSKWGAEVMEAKAL